MGVFSQAADRMIRRTEMANQRDEQRRQEKMANIGQAVGAIGQAAGAVATGLKARAENPEFNIDPNKQTSADRIDLARRAIKSKLLKDDGTLEDSFKVIEDIKARLASKDTPASTKRKDREDLREIRRKLNSKLPTTQMLAQLMNDASRAAGAAGGAGDDDKQVQIGLKIKQQSKDTNKLQRIPFEKNVPEAVGRLQQNLRDEVVDMVDERHARAAAPIVSMISANLGDINKDKVEYIGSLMKNRLTNKANRIISKIDPSNPDKEELAQQKGTASLELLDAMHDNLNLLDPSRRKAEIVNTITDQWMDEMGIPPHIIKGGGMGLRAMRSKLARTISASLDQDPNFDFDDFSEDMGKGSMVEIGKMIDKLDPNNKLIGATFFGLGKGEVANPEKFQQAGKKLLLNHPVGLMLASKRSRPEIEKAFSDKSGPIYKYAMTWAKFNGMEGMNERVIMNRFIKNREDAFVGKQQAQRSLQSGFTPGL